MKRPIGYTLVAAFLMLSEPARAEGDAATAAEDLFQRAKPLMTSGKWSDACPLLAESYRLDPAGGTLQNLAVCYESAGKWASAYARFQELKTLAKKATPVRPDRLKLIDDHLAKVTPKVSHLFLVVPDETPNAEVDIDGVKYQRVAWSAGIAIDPGPHDLTVNAPGKKSYRSTITIPSEPTEQRVPIPALESAAPPPAELVEGRHSKDDDAERERVEADRRTRRTGLFVGGAGVVLLGAASGFGGLAIWKNNEGKDTCQRTTRGLPADANYDASGRCIVGSEAETSANDSKASARVFANVANVTAALGVLAVGAGIYLAFVRATSTGTIRVGPTVGGAFAEGTF